MSTSPRKLLLLLVLALTITACSGEEPTEDPTTEPATTSEPADSPEPTTTETADAPTSDPAPTDQPTADPSPTSASGPVEPVVVEVDFEQRAPDNTTVRVSRFEVTDLNIAVDVEIVVAAERAFVQFNNTQQNPAAIVDDAGNTYPLIPPEGNGTLMIDGGERLEGTLSFQGPLKSGATTIQLVLNPNSEPDGTSVNDQLQPHFTFPEVALDGS